MYSPAFPAVRYLDPEGPPQAWRQGSLFPGAPEVEHLQLNLLNPRRRDFNKVEQLQLNFVELGVLPANRRGPELFNFPAGLQQS